MSVSTHNFLQNLIDFSSFQPMDDGFLGFRESAFPSHDGVNGTPETFLTSNVSTVDASVFVLLVMFSLCTIFGNSLVMLAVRREHYLKSPPNYFVASLAAADFSVGVLIVPFEAITQLLNRRWIFGDIWCDLWHSLDVLLTTASILNLCVISLDRYWAICTPLSYSRRMTSKRAHRFIALVWICSTLISLPAIFWWRGVRKEPVPPETCPFTEDVGYLISSSCISFYIPLSVMLCAYYKIYLAAVRQSKSIQQGAKFFAHGNGTEIKLRMHRGGSSNSQSVNATPNGTYNNNLGATPRKSVSFVKSDPSKLSLLRGSSVESTKIKASHFWRKKGKRKFSESLPLERSIDQSEAGPLAPPMNLPGMERPTTAVVSAAVRLISDPLVLIAAAAAATSSIEASPGSSGMPNSPTRNIIPTGFRSSRRSFTVARKIAKFAKEKKAAKTLAIVLGVFIMCWLPFFVMNILCAVCTSCAKQVVLFDLTTWLGWINSAINPVIYACWSQDFRRAFVRLLCCGRCLRARQLQYQRRISVV